MKLLVVDDEKRLREFIGMFCEGNGYEVVKAALPSEALAVFEQTDVDIALIDYMMPEMDGISLMKKLKAVRPELEVIVITAHGSIETAVNAMREGAADFLPKPFNSNELQAAIERTRRYCELNGQLRRTENALNTVIKLQESEAFIGRTPQVRELLEITDRLAQSTHTNVLITGESGTGKELIARRLHSTSPRADKPFMAVNCAAVVDTLFESEFFGHRKGAFTGADSDQPGWFERADGSTLFLDEISEIPQHLQAKLLRVLEDRTVTRVGETKARPVDVRLVASSNQPVEELVKQGRFRTDLYYRLSGYHLHVPPLRERAADIPLICEHFLQMLSRRMPTHVTSISPEAMTQLMHYTFPGNVRELRNLMERALILAENGVIRLFPLGEVECPESSLNLVLLEEQAIRAAMKQAGNNKTHAAALLGVHWQVLHRKLQKMGSIKS